MRYSTILCLHNSWHLGVAKGKLIITECSFEHTINPKLQTVILSKPRISTAECLFTILIESFFKVSFILRWKITAAVGEHRSRDRIMSAKTSTLIHCQLQFLEAGRWEMIKIGRFCWIWALHSGRYYELITQYLMKTTISFQQIPI